MKRSIARSVVLVVALAGGVAAGTAAFGQAGPSAGDVAPALTRAPGAGDVLPAAIQGGLGGIQDSSARRVLTGAESSWVATDTAGNVCTITTIAARPNEVRQACSPPSMVAGRAFVDVGVSSLSSPGAKTWSGVVDGLAAPDVRSVRISFADGTVRTVTPTADGAFSLDGSDGSLRSSPTKVEALASDGAVLEAVSAHE